MLKIGPNWLESILFYQQTERRTRERFNHPSNCFRYFAFCGFSFLYRLNRIEAKMGFMELVVSVRKNFWILCMVLHRRVNCKMHSLLICFIDFFWFCVYYFLPTTSVECTTIDAFCATNSFRSVFCVCASVCFRVTVPKNKKFCPFNYSNRSATFA